MTEIEFNHKILSINSYMQSFALSMTSDHENVNDLLQETYLRAIIHKDMFEPDSNLKAWLFTIMRNIFINKYRKDSLVNKIIDNTKDFHYISRSSHALGLAPDSIYNHSELERMINDLTIGNREPFLMHFQGYKYKEIAETLNLSIGTVKSRIFFCRKKMMKKLKDFQN